ncbi:unnamed protein product [Lasius platythorax]|uniref:Ant venom allergen Sol i 2/4 domain-containing protein n=1 Tax=Lasius platythorax TaxID=488582 RepID=A0AAV2NZU5_9HYME
MKNLLLVTCLLTISFAIDPAKVKKFYDGIDICVQELHTPGVPIKLPLNIEEYTSDIVLCSLHKHKLIDEQGLIRKEKLIEYNNYIISDKTKLRQANEIISMCVEQAYQSPGSNYEKTKAFIKCGIRVIDLIDKPQ